MKLSALKEWAFSVKRNVYTLYRVTGDPRVPLLPRIIIIGIIGYAVSPIDLIPDFIPVLGHLDDLILLPLGIWLAVKLVPYNIWEEYRSKYQDEPNPGIPRSKWAATVIVAIWGIMFITCALYLRGFLRSPG